MFIFAASFLASLVILGALTFVGLTAGIGIFSGSKRGGGVQFVCLLVAVAWAIFCSIYAGMAALAGVVVSGIFIATALFLNKRIKIRGVSAQHQENKMNKPKTNSSATPAASIAVGSKLKVSAAKLKPFLDHHGLSTSKDVLTVEVLRMGMGSTDINPNQTVFIVIEIMLIDNQDPAIDGKIMNVGFSDLVTIKS